MTRPHKMRIVVWALVPLLLLLPLVAMQFTPQVDWDVADFSLFAVMLLGAGGAFEVVIRGRTNAHYRVASGLALATGFALMWMNLAVGVIGTEHNPANTFYVGILGIGILGSILSRLRAEGMAKSLLTMAVAQALVPVFVWTTGLGEAGVAGFQDVWKLTGCFVSLWLGAAWLFQKSARLPLPSALESNE